MTTLRGALIAVLASAAAALVLGSTTASAQSGSVEVHAHVEDDRFRVEIREMSAPVGVIEATITGLPGDATICEVAGIGGCNLVDGVAQIAALDPEGFDGATDLATVELAEMAVADDVQVRVGPTYDVTGQPMTVIAGSGIVVIADREPPIQAEDSTDESESSAAPAPSQNPSSETSSPPPDTETGDLAVTEATDSSSSALLVGIAGAAVLVGAGLFALRRRV